MTERIIFIKPAVVGVMAYISAKLGIIGPLLSFFAILMIIDNITGLMAAAYEKSKNPESPTAGISSKVGVRGIQRKFCYVLLIVMTFGLDWAIMVVLKEMGYPVPIKAFFGLLTICWFILNEMISILENADRLEAKIPPFLRKLIPYLRGRIDMVGSQSVADLEKIGGMNDEQIRN